MRSLQVLPASSQLPAPLFAASAEKFNDIKQMLTSPWALASDAAAIERELRPQGNELIRRLLEEYLNLRCSAAVVSPVVDAAGHEHRYRRDKTSRALLSSYGKITVWRPSFEKRGRQALHPHEAALNFPASLYSLEVQKEAAILASGQSFDTAGAALERRSAAHVPKRQFEAVVRSAAQDFWDFYDIADFTVPPADTGEFLVLSADHKGVTMIRRDLTATTRRRADEATQTHDSRNGKGKKNNKKRMATVAAVYTVKPYQRSADQVIRGLRHVRDAEPGAKRPRPEHKRLIATMRRSTAAVVKELFREAMLRDPKRTKTWLFLVDGESNLQTLAVAEAARLGVKVKFVLDFIHALEYLWKVSTTSYEEADPCREAWVLQRLDWMLQGRVGDVVADLRRLAAEPTTEKADRVALVKTANYMKKRESMMGYKELLAAGAPIATGIIEGACRHLVCDRMEITGARWSLATAEAVLQLRTLISSGDFEAYWSWHERAERHRNHDVHYAEIRPPALEPLIISIGLRVVK